MLKLITDTHIAKQIAIQLRNHGIDVVRLEERTDLANDASDTEILEWATTNQRAVVSLDEDFQKLHYRWMLEAKTHSGIFLGTKHIQGVKGIGTIVKFLVNYAEIVEDMSLIENDLVDIE